MTGTAKTEEREFRDIYGLNVVVMPTNQPVARKDNADIVYRTENAKFEAVVDEIIAEHEKGRPVLVGTRSIEKSERLAMLLRRRGVECNVLNAKYHEQEAQIIKDAGVVGRRDDRDQHGRPRRRHQARRGRRRRSAGCTSSAPSGTSRGGSTTSCAAASGRQGDPGSTRFYIALDDELMRLFGAERIQKMMDFVKFTDETPIEAGILSRSIENAQSKVENHNYEIRKQVLEYDDVMNKQREVIYAERRRVLEGQPLRDFFVETLRTKVSDAVDNGAPPEEHPSEWDLEAILDELQLVFPVKDQHRGRRSREARSRRDEGAACANSAIGAYEAKEAEVTPDIMRMVESQYIMLPIIDRLWVDHLYIMDALKAGIGLRGYGQKDPRVEYEKEAYEIFEDLKSNIADEAIKAVFSVRIEIEPEAAPQPVAVGSNGNGAATAFEPLPTGQLIPQAAPRMDPAGRGTPARARAARGGRTRTHKPRRRAGQSCRARNEKVGRNELCPCGSGKKYKRCHGAAA